MRNKQRRTVKPQAQIDKLRSHNLWNRRMSYQIEYTNLARLLLLILPLLWIKLRAISFFIVPLLCWINENRINGRICKSIKTRNCMQSTLYLCIQNAEKCCTERLYAYPLNTGITDDIHNCFWNTQNRHIFDRISKRRQKYTYTYRRMYVSKCWQLC